MVEGGVMGGKRAAVLVLVFLASAFSAGAAEEFSGFLGDYSQLEPTADEYADFLYVAPGAYERLQGFGSFMIDQPEIFIDPESKKKGMKPDDMMALAEMLRGVIIEKLEDRYEITDRPGPGTLYVRLAASELYMKKKVSKNPLAYTPVGFAVNQTRKALTKNLAKKIKLIELTVEAEFLDSKTGERLAALVARRGQRKDKEKGQKAEPGSWEELDEMFDEIGRRFRCRLDNAHMSREQWIDCGARPVAEK